MISSLKSGVAALAGLVACSVAAQAADLPSRAAPPPYIAPVLVSGWDGFYAGSTYGYGWTNFRTSEGSSRSKTVSGQSGGALVGYNFQAGHFVYGVEGGIDLNVIRGTIPGQAGLNPSRVDTLDDIRLRGRLGYEFGWFMPFVAGGAVINETYVSTPSPNNFYGDVDRRVGWTAGAGVDFKLNPHNILSFLPESLFGPLILRLEYLHDSVPRSNYAIGPIGHEQTFRTESSTNLARVALIYRFGDTAPRPYTDAAGNVNWGGGYGGILGGYGDASGRNRFPGLGRTTSHGDGGIGGIYAGTNFMFNRIMLGVDGSTSWRDLSGNGVDPATGHRTSFREYVQGDIRGRVGYAFGNFLPFAAAGIAFTRSEQRDLVTGSEVGRIPADNLAVGGGVDYRISQRVSLRAEYLYETSFNNKTVNLNGNNVKQNLDANIFRFGAAYHFE